MWWERIKAARSAFSLVGAAMHPLKTFLWTGRLKFVFFPVIAAALTFPLPDELAVPVTATCRKAEAAACKSQFVECRFAGSSMDPQMPGLARMHAVNACMDAYEKRCAKCGDPIELHCRTYWDRWQKSGPMWFRWLPGGESMWNKGPGSTANCEYKRAILAGVD